MSREITVVLIDGYIDDPAALGVPPYISPMIRAVAGASLDAGADRVEYITIDMIRDGARIPEGDVTVVLSGNTVPGKYLRSMPMSLKELDAIFPKLTGWRLIGGSAADSEIASRFDFSIKRDLAASLYDGISGKEVGERLRTLEEWNRWMLLGADIVTSHQDFPQPLVAEIESYRGCHRFSSGGCSYCIEPMKGRPLMRTPSQIIEEASRLRGLGVRNIRVGGQTCIVSYGSDPDSPVPRPNPDAVEELFSGLDALGFDTIHVDNANAAVISTYPEESEQVLRSIADHCTDGNVVALGMESADPRVVIENNLNSTSEQVMDAVRLINRVGSDRGPRGMPRLLPGINIICGLDGETAATYRMDMEVLERMCEEGLMIRRINIRQVLPVRREFSVKVDQRRFRRFKEDVRETIDRTMLERVAPFGTVLKDVYMELNDGGVTFGRQIGSYPLLVGVPYRLEVGTAHDIMVTDWGYRSITGITYPFDINSMPMSALEALPGVGKKRAKRLVLERPFSDLGDLSRAIDDPKVVESLGRFVVFERSYCQERSLRPFIYLFCMGPYVNIPEDHPRYKSLMTRERLAEMVQKGLVTPTGLISHGRGEAFDYLMGEKSTEPAMDAERAAAAFLLSARNPVVCVNGNAAALDAPNLIRLAETVGAKIEVNLFHRTPERMEGLISYLESQGAKEVLGRDPECRIQGLNHDRALCTREGIYDCDVIVVPIEDGDRAEALVSMGKTVISIDLNPLSRTSRTATVPISDEMTRALENMIRFAEELRGDDEAILKIKESYSKEDSRRRTVECICESLMAEFEGDE